MTKLASLYPEHIETVTGVWSRALELAGCDGVLISGGTPHEVFLDDQEYPFKVNAHFKHFAPVLDNPHCFIYFRPGEQPRLLFYRPVDFWHKPADPPDEFWTSAFDLRMIARPEDARGELPDDLKGCALVGEWSTMFDSWGLGPRNPQALLNCVHFHRAWKTRYELECLRDASRLGAAAHHAAARTFRDGGTEFDIHLAFQAACGLNEHQLPYGNIIALNEHGSVLHYQHQSRHQPGERRSFLIDAGAQFHGYASDITRTHAAADGDFAELVAAMNEGQLALCERVRPGLHYPDLQTEAHLLAGRLLERFGIVELDAEGAVESGITRYFFPHGVGHYLGLQVHDAGGFLADESGNTLDRPKDQPFLRLTRTVEENQVFTVEPGLYFIDSLLADLKASRLAGEVNWNRVEAFRPYGGVRIEDNVAVNADGHENFTRAAFDSLGG